MEHREYVRNVLGVQDLLRAVLLAATRSAQDAEDLLQDVLVLLWEKSGEYDPARPFRAWALGVARLEMLKWRQRRARSRPVSSLEALEALTQAAERRAEELDGQRKHLEDCLQRLSPPARDLLRLRYGESLAVGEIARRVASTAAAVERALVRARTAIRSCMELKWSRAKA